MRVLAVDTTTPRGSLAVAGPEGVLAEARVVTADGHSRWLLPAAAALLAGLRLAPKDLDLFAVTVGPGSFTGLRVGLGSVQGLALASGRPCVGVSTLDVIAAAAAGAAGTVVAVLDAFRGEVFSAVYDGVGRLQGERTVGALADRLEGLPGGSAFAGDLDEGLKELVRARVEGAAFPPTDPFRAARLALLARSLAGEGAAVPPSALRPLYLRGADLRPPRR